MAIVLAVVSQSLCWNGSADAQCVDYTKYLRWVGFVPTASSDIAVSGSHLFVAGSTGVDVMDITSPEAPELVGSVVTDAADEIEISGNFAYTIGLYSAFQVIDITDPQSPALVASLAIGYPDGLAISGNHAFVADGNDGFKVVDITAPDAPVIVGDVAIPFYANDVVIFGNYAYVGDIYTGVVVVDVSVPESPEIITTLLATDGVVTLAVSGGYLYFTDFAFHLVVVDISAPESPAITGSVTLPTGGTDIAFSGNHAFVPDSFYQLLAVDVSNPAAPTIVGTVTMGAPTLAVAISGNHAYVDTILRLEIVDITALEPVEPVGSVDTPDRAASVAVSGNYAYVADDLSGLQVVFVGVPESPVIVGSVDTPGRAKDVALLGNYALVADGNSGLQIIDISNPAFPDIVTGVGTPSGEAVTVSGNNAYVAGVGLQVVDVSAPESPVVTGSVDTGGSSIDVAVSGNYAYLSDFFGLKVIDVSVPASPAVVGSVNLGFLGDVAVSGNYVYAVGFEHLYAVDVSVPASPVIVGSVGTRGYGWAIAVSGGFVYLTNISDVQGIGILVVDISTPTSPFIVGSADTPVIAPTGPAPHAYGVAVSGGYAYVANARIGLTILPAHCPSPPLPVLITNFEAHARDGNVLIRWDLWSDEGLDRFTLYRGDDAHAQPVAIAEGRFDSNARTHVDTSVLPGRTYHYSLVIHTAAGADIRSQVATVTMPRIQTALRGSFPNPFNTRASIEYTLGERSHAVVGIYDPAGRLVARLDAGEADAGMHHIEWDGRNQSGNAVGSGVYFYRLEGVPGAATKKMVRLK